MILICGIPTERPLALAVRAAARAHAPAVVLSQREIERWALVVELDGATPVGELRTPEQAWSLDAFAGIYARLVDPPTLPEARGHDTDEIDEQRLERAQALHDGLLAWLELTPARVANRVGAMTSNVSKPFQAQLIQRCGFAVPPTLVTNDAEAVRRFVGEHGRVIYKSISSVRSIVRELAPGRAGGLSRLRNLPTQFQARVAGTDVRVHVVGAEVFATSVRSDAVDYRYASRDGMEIELEASELPSEIRARCLALSRELELPFCGIDLRCGDDGRWYCFEVNPSPAYSFYEEQTGQPISDALIDYLTGAQEGRSGATDRERGADLGHGSRRAPQ